MSTDGQVTKCRRNIAENLSRLSRAHERYRQTDDRQTGDRQADGRQHIANVNVSSRSLKMHNKYICDNMNLSPGHLSQIKIKKTIFCQIVSKSVDIHRTLKTVHYFELKSV